MRVVDGQKKMTEKLKDFINKLSCILLGGALWKAGGTINKNYRRIGFSLVLSFLCYKQTNNFLASLFTFLISFTALSIGYGIPDNTDEGSALGRFWFKITSNYNWTRILVRLTCGLAYACVFIPLLLTNYEESKLIQALLLPFFTIILVELEIGELEEILIGSTFMGLYII
jgi:hypothetical protein